MDQHFEIRLIAQSTLGCEGPRSGNITRIEPNRCSRRDARGGVFCPGKIGDSAAPQLSIPRSLFKSSDHFIAVIKPPLSLFGFVSELWNFQLGGHGLRFCMQKVEMNQAPGCRESRDNTNA